MTPTDKPELKECREAFGKYWTKELGKSLLHISCDDHYKSWQAAWSRAQANAAVEVERVTVEQFYKLWDENPNRTAAEHISWSYPSGVMIITANKEE